MLSVNQALLFASHTSHVFRVLLLMDDPIDANGFIKELINCTKGDDFGLNLCQMTDCTGRLDYD